MVTKLPKRPPKPPKPGDLVVSDWAVAHAKEVADKAKAAARAKRAAAGIDPPRRGRPRKPLGTALSARIELAVTPDEKEAWAEKAELDCGDGWSLNRWMRALGNARVAGVRPDFSDDDEHR